MGRRLLRNPSRGMQAYGGCKPRQLAEYFSFDYMLKKIFAKLRETIAPSRAAKPAAAGGKSGAHPKAHSTQRTEERRPAGGQPRRGHGTKPHGDKAHGDKPHADRPHADKSQGHGHEAKSQGHGHEAR